MKKIAPYVLPTWLNVQSGHGQQIADWGKYGVDQFAFNWGGGYGDGADDKQYGDGEGGGTSQTPDREP